MLVALFATLAWTSSCSTAESRPTATPTMGGHDLTFPCVPIYTMLTMVIVAWEHGVGGLPRRVCTVYGPRLWPAKMALPLAREWFSTTDYIGSTNCRML